MASLPAALSCLHETAYCGVGLQQRVMQRRLCEQAIAEFVMRVSAPASSASSWPDVGTAHVTGATIGSPNKRDTCRHKQRR